MLLRNWKCGAVVVVVATAAVAVIAVVNVVVAAAVAIVVVSAAARVPALVAFFAAGASAFPADNAGCRMIDCLCKCPTCERATQVVSEPSAFYGDYGLGRTAARMSEDLSALVL